MGIGMRIRKEVKQCSVLGKYRPVRGLDGSDQSVFMSE